MRRMWIPAAILVFVFANCSGAGESSARKNDTTSIAAYGATGNGRFFIEELAVTPLAGEGKSLVVYNGPDQEVFGPDHVGNVFCVWRNTKAPSAYPEDTGYNYFPSLVTSVICTVTDHVDGRTVKVDYVYNGGDPDSPRATVKQSGYMGQNVRPILKKAFEDPDRPETLVFEDDRIYITKGYPNIDYAADKSLVVRRSNTGKTPPILYLAIDDPFDSTRHASGNSGSNARHNFGSETFFDLSEFGDHGVLFDGVDILPPVFRQPTAQQARMSDYFFVDRKSYNLGQNSRTCEIRDSNTFRLRDMIVARLGHDLEGASHNMPQFGRCLAGGKEGDRGDGVLDVLAYTTYRLRNTPWVAWQVHNLKARCRAGVLFEALNDHFDTKGPIPIQEDETLKKGRYDDVPTQLSHGGRNDDHLLMTLNSDNFNFYMVANQDWTGGTGHNNIPHNTFYANVGGDDETWFHYGNKADFHAFYGSKGAGNPDLLMDGTRVATFNRIPLAGDVIPKARGVSYYCGKITKIDGRVVTVSGDLSKAPFQEGDYGGNGVHHSRFRIDAIDRENNRLTMQKTRGAHKHWSLVEGNDFTVEMLQTPTEWRRRGVVNKISDTKWRIWGYHLQNGDRLRTDEGVHTIVGNYVARENHYPDLWYDKHYTASPHVNTVTFDKPHRKSAEEAEFTVIRSRSESLLGRELPGTHFFGGCPSPLADNQGKASGHLFYTDAGVNMRFRGILLKGYFRSTATGYPTSPAAKDLRSCARYMYFKDTFMATPAGGVGREWTPMGIGYRQRLDPKDVECVVDGGHVGIQQNARYPDNTASITFMGRPRPLTLKFARYELYRPDFSNPAFNGWGRRTHGMAPQPETIHVFIEDQTLNLTDLEDTRVRVSIKGKCTIITDNYRGQIRKDKTSRDRGFGISIVGAVPGSTLTIRGSGGMFGVKLESSAVAKVLNGPDRLRIHLTSHTHLADPYSGKSFYFQGWTKGIDNTGKPSSKDWQATYDASIRIADSQGNDLDPNN